MNIFRTNLKCLWHKMNTRQQIMENIGLWAANNAINLIYWRTIKDHDKLIKEYMKTSKRAREARKNLPKTPQGKKRQEIWDGPGTTYVPRQDHKLNRLQISKSYQE